MAKRGRKTNAEKRQNLEQNLRQILKVIVESVAKETGCTFDEAKNNLFEHRTFIMVELYKFTKSDEIIKKLVKMLNANWFKNIQTLAELKAQYRKLAFANHPDHGGDTKNMANIIAEYNKLLKKLAA